MKLYNACPNSNMKSEPQTTDIFSELPNPEPNLDPTYEIII